MLAATALRARAGRYAVLCVCVRGLPPLECCEGDVHDLNAPAVYHLISAAMADAKPKGRCHFYVGPESSLFDIGC